MASHFIPYIILTGFIGFHCQVVTVSKMSVKEGKSISIPCLYDQSYRNHVKCLCRGSTWGSCSYVVKTNKPDNTGKFSISDDTDQRIFTVTINNLDGTKDNTHHWCAVEIPGIWRDIRKEFQLSITDTPSLYVGQQEFTAFEGGSVTVVCHYTNQRVKEWCRLGSTCINQQTRSINGATVTINETGTKVYSVTMSELTLENSGWYWCANDDSQVPVHIIVQKHTSTSAGTTVNAKPEGSLPTSTQLVPILTGVTLNPSTLPNSTQSQTGGNSPQDKNSSPMIILIATLVSLLLLLVAAALAGWRIRRYKSKPEAQDISRGSQPGNDPEVLYTTVIRNKGLTAKEKDNLSEESPTYSNIAMRTHVQQAIEPADGSVIYSTVKGAEDTGGQ